MSYTTADIKEFQAMVYMAITQGLTFEASSTDDVHKIIYTGGF
jgi:hypothetical protein